jgi:Tfp pilus assembly protein PilE
MNFKKSQSGRSMVEMLGVLAIIGVLSVGGIAGYSLSMRRHRANQVVDTISKYSLIVYGNCQQQVLDEKIDTIYDCSGENVTSYANAGVGGLPTGVKSIRFAIISDPKSDGSEAVKTDVVFTDTKLCQTVASMVETSAIWCSINSTIDIDIKQN